MARHPGWPATLVHGSVGLRPHRMRDGLVWSEVRCANEDWLRPWEPVRPLPWQTQHSPGEYPNLLRSLRRGARDGSLLPWAITYEGRFAGQLTLGSVVRGATCSAQAGYWVDGRLAGRGIVPCALAMAVDHAFLAGELHRIEVNIRPENTASLRVVEKLGFREEGYLSRYLHIDGEWRDHVAFALTVEDVAPDGLLRRWRARASA
jgi:ribosomal-protein-alanine N-acetyltransferase